MTAACAWFARLVPGRGCVGRYLLGSLLLITLTAEFTVRAEAAPAALVRRDFQLMPKPGEKIALGTTHYFTYGFDKPAKIGTAIMRVEIFTRDGRRDTSFTVKGDADMPSMRGAHAAGDKPFSLSNKGLYLLPVRLVMPGDWEISLTFLQKGTVIYRGAYLFDI